VTHRIKRIYFRFNNDLQTENTLCVFGSRIRFSACAAKCLMTNSGKHHASVMSRIPLSRLWRIRRARTLTSHIPLRGAPMPLPRLLCAVSILAAAPSMAFAPPPSRPAPRTAYDATLARQLGADAYGMRSYVLVLLRSSDHPVPKGPQRDAMFKGHMANMQRLAKAGKLVMAGPLDGREGLRGLFVFAVKDIAAARTLVATDPVIARGEMVAEYHDFYASAALMRINALHQRVMQKPF
jgi:uncharacterized protein YciI